MTVDHLLDGWKMKLNEILMAVSTQSSITSEGFVKLVSATVMVTAAKAGAFPKRTRFYVQKISAIVVTIVTIPRNLIQMG